MIFCLHLLGLPSHLFCEPTLEASSKLRDLSKKVEDADFKMVLAELHNALADAKLESGELKFRLASAQEQIATLKTQLESKVQGKPEYTTGRGL